MSKTDQQSGLTLEALGWTAELENSFAALRERQWVPGRVVAEDKHHYVVFSPHGALTGRVAGRLLHSAKTPAELPKVGDWVALTPYPREEKALIHQVLPRQTVLSRKLPGRETAEQVLVANVALAFVVQSADERFNPRLLERYLLMITEGGIRPVVALNKCDLCASPDELAAQAAAAAPAAPVLMVSAKTGRGIRQLAQLIRPRETVVFIGPSGVGKSSLINRLYGEEIAATAEVRESDLKGRHTTAWRELIVLPNGGLVIDTPGMREFHLWTRAASLRDAFPEIVELETACKFTRCSHTAEKNCAVLAAVAQGRLSPERHQSFLKLKRELEYLEKAGRVRRRKDGGRPGDYLASHPAE